MSELDDFSAPLAPQAPAAPANSLDDFSAPLARPVAQQKAVISANDNGDAAASALAIGKRTGIPASVVQSDPEGYAAHDRQQTAKQAVQNPYIAKYVSASEHGAAISSDDWDALGRSSETLQNLSQERINGISGLKAVGRIATEFSKGAEEGYGDRPPTGVSNEFISTMQHFGIFPDEARTTANPFRYFNEAMIMPVASGINDFMRGLNTTLYAGAGVAGQTSAELGSSQGDSERLRREVINLGNYLMVDSMARPGTEAAPMPSARMEGAKTPISEIDSFLGKVQGVVSKKEIDDFLKSKEEHAPVLQITKANTAADALDKAVEVAQESKTKQRSPETFEEFGAAHGDEVVHVDAQKIVELYEKEGKVPAEGDGLFGFVPNIAARMQDAAAAGGEVTIPTSQYIAHIDPTVHEGLRESVRLHDDGVTLEEAKELEKTVNEPKDPQEIKLVNQDPVVNAVDAEKTSLGINPLLRSENIESIAQILARHTGDSAEIHPGIKVQFRKPENWDEHEAEIAKAIQDEFQRIAPNAKSSVVDSIEEGREGSRTNALMLPDGFNPANDRTVFTLASTDHLGDVHHESIHQLRRGFFTGEEWTTLRNAALEENWHGKYKIDRFYRDSPVDIQLEEAVAERFREWMKNEKSDVPPEVKTIFEKLKDFFDKVLEHISRILGKKATWEDIFKKVDSGEVGGREQSRGIAGTNLMRSQGPKDPFMSMLFKDGKSVGITEAEFKTYSDKIVNQERAILDKSVMVGKREAGRRLTPEWKRNESAVRDEVVQELRERGPFAAESYFRKNNIDLARGPENAAANADSLAPLFGFETGQDLLRGLESIETEKAASGKNAAAQLKDTIAAETAARMEQRYGNLAANIGKEAREIALADHTFDVMADEIRILAKAAGATPPLSRTEMVEWAKASFERSGITEAEDWAKHERAVARNGREAEKALLAGDFREAFEWKQKQFLAATQAKQSLALQKVIDGAEKKIDRFSSEETIKGIEQTYLDQIRQMLTSVGVSSQFQPSVTPAKLSDFVADSEGQLAVAPWLMESGQPKLQDMSVVQFREFVDSMKSMEHVGRQAAQVENARGKAELQNVIFDIKKELDRFPFIDQPTLNKSLPQRLASAGRQVTAWHLLVERMLDYTDRFDPHGPLTEWLDRPLRDSNVKELQLTEQVTKMLRELKQHTDASINERVPNALIPDAGDKSGFMAMTHQNLRQVMLNMGNWSNLKKLSDGFGVNEADLRRWVDRYARPQDVAWVNGVWKIFDHLKPEADAMQLRDTGVPADTIEGVPWDTRAGRLAGGYYPIVYDKFNSNIQGHMAAKNPVFDTHYVQATTPHGYTVARTDFQGALDLSGNFLASRVKGMIHDIAFREAIRNANKLISNQEFRTALAQKWGQEAANLLPGWLRDIANSHTLDETDSQGLVRAMSLVRQNVVQTLIAYNPGTFIKHGFTAAVMSADRVGAGPLLKAASELNVGGIAKDLVKRNEVAEDAAFMDAFRDSIDQGERGENARQFVLNSSAVMRNRQRQYDDSIRGAVDDMNKAGTLQTLANFRQRQMLYGRMAVAFSDGLSAMPTWLAAYKKAYLAGEEHADAVFIADKEVSRAHGSSFVGDQPVVTRVRNTMPGEIARWFVPLYKFWNHTVNNNFQLAWDAAATIRGEKPGEAPEPGANAASIARRVGLILATIFIEEQASAALDKDKQGFLHAMAMSTLRYFGGGFIGLRELSNGLASGYEPSVGMLGTIFKAGAETAKDLSKATSAGAQASKNWIIHTATAIGMLTGVGGSQVGKVASFGKDLATGREQPQTFNQFRQGFRTGHSKARVH